MKIINSFLFSALALSVSGVTLAADTSIEMGLALTVEQPKAFGVVPVVAGGTQQDWASRMPGSGMSSKTLGFCVYGSGNLQYSIGTTSLKPRSVDTTGFYMSRITVGSGLFDTSNTWARYHVHLTAGGMTNEVNRGSTVSALTPTMVADVAGAVAAGCSTPDVTFELKINDAENANVLPSATAAVTDTLNITFTPV